MKRSWLVRSLPAVALALGAGLAAAGPAGTIEGSVVGPDGAPLAGARIEITCGAVRKVAVADARGNFSVAGLPEGTCTVRASRPGVGQSTQVVAVGGGTIATVLVGLAPPVSRTPVPEAIPTAVAAEPPAPDPAPRDRAKAERKPAEAPRAVPMKRPAPKPVAPPPRQVVRPDLPARPGGWAHAKVAQFRELPPDGDDQVIAAGGWAPVRVFPVPQYTRREVGPRTDFRETIYWNPTVQTDARGEAEVAFVVSDAITAFRATAEGFSAAGTPGAGQLAIQSKLPMSLDAHLPVEVTAGDTIELPVTIANATAAPLDVTLDARFGSAFRVTGAPAPGALHLPPHGTQAIVFPLRVVATAGDADVTLAARADGLADELHKTIRIVPRGFPFERSAAGTARRGERARHELDLAGALPGSIQARVTIYPSPIASMTEGMAGMIREPGGCFEQTSASNYPNVMILSYLQAHDAADPALIDRTQGTLARGYKLLTGYETPARGYEWFGKTPGHEALTAYGLMEFADMAKVHDVDPKMVERTAAWLMSRRDGKGGFLRSAAAIDSFGRASEPTTNAYIMWALAEAGRTSGLDRELAAQRALGATTRDPYLLALATRTNLRVAPTARESAAMAARLAAMQGADGGFAGAKETITRSGGESLVIETTALATLALLAAPGDPYAAQVRAAVGYLERHRGGYGQWSNTQATILGLKALTAYAETQRQMTTGGSATVIVNGRRLRTIEFEAGRKDPLVWDDLAGALVAGKNVIEVELATGERSDAALPYAIAVGYRSARPQSSPDAKVAVTTALAKTQAKMGEGVALKVHVENRTAGGIPMALARVGIPGGMVFQTWQLKELRDKGLIDFYETRPREVILYWRGMAPSAKHDLSLALLAAVPGRYEAPASSAYLYYTAEHKAWSPPVRISINRN